MPMMRRTQAHQRGAALPVQCPIPLVLLAVVVFVSGCASSAPRGDLDSASSAAAVGSAPGRLLIISIAREPSSVADKTLRRSGSGIGPDTSRPFNAGLVVRDERDEPHPYLIADLPRLGSDSWRVFLDGRMETTYRLRPGLSWHDGVPLTAEDFVLAWRVYRVPDFGYADSVPIAQIEEIQAPEPLSVLIRWRVPFPDALRLDSEALPPLPAHVLGAAFESQAADAFVAHPYWGDGHVGLGPYRLDRWELGSFIEGTSFAGHALGPPRMDRIKLLFIPDPNATVANLLSGNAHAADGRSVRFQQAIVLRQRWQETGGGRVILSPTEVRFTIVQARPELVTPAALLDQRVRQAVAHAVDRQGMADALLEGQGLAADTLVVPQVRYFAALDRALQKYPYDLRRTELLMAEAGFPKAPDGFFVGPGGGRFPLNLSISALAQNEAEATIMADGFQRAGFESSLQVLSQAQATDRQVRSSYPALSSTSNTNGFEPPSRFLRASEVATAENRWRGSNRGGWIHPEFERLAAAYDTTLEAGERDQRAIELLRLVSQELPAFPLYYNFVAIPHDAELTGPAGGLNWNWNIHEWTLSGQTRAPDPRGI
jgi:peptide/nickel transport system substrate-binding protein